MLRDGLGYIERGILAALATATGHVFRRCALCLRRHFSDPQRAFHFCGRVTLSIRGFYARFDYSEMIQHIREVLLQTRHLAALAGDLDSELLK
jgi:hypothetical protein